MPGCLLLRVKYRFSVSVLFICIVLILICTYLNQAKKGPETIRPYDSDQTASSRKLVKCDGFTDDWNDDWYDDCRSEPTPEPTTIAPSVSREASLSPSVTTNPTSSIEPSSSPSTSQMPSISIQPSATTATYVPGNLTLLENGLLLSTGLKSRIIATSGQRVQYKNGQKSTVPFHGQPDGAAVFVDPHPHVKGWVYVSNSEEESRGGGVGAIRFDEDGNVVHYKMILTNTNRNCQGGKTPWHTFVSCEENHRPRGQCWETDPFGRHEGRRTYLGGDGGNFEAVACDNRNPLKPFFFVTNDLKDGEVRRFTPNATAVKEALRGGDPWNILGTPGQLDYLIIEPDEEKGTTGTFYWSPDLKLGKENARQYFKKCEGIDFVDGKLYFVSSWNKNLFILDMDSRTYRKSYLKTHEFQGQPDSLLKTEDIVYIGEQSKVGDSGVFGRDSQGNIFTILRSKKFWGDATGIAFSPDNTRLYVAIQDAGKLFEITRQDGMAFNARVRDLSYNEPLYT